MNSNPNQMHAQMPLLLAEIVLASAKNVNRLRALRRHRCRQALSKPPIIYKHCKAAYLAQTTPQPVLHSLYLQL